MSDRRNRPAGPRLIEYVIIVGVIATVALAALFVLGGQVTRILSTNSGGV